MSTGRRLYGHEAPVMACLWAALIAYCVAAV
jgi:hypothetical protein